MTLAATIDRKHAGPRMSKIVKHAGLVYLCGQTSSGSHATSIQEQTKEVLNRIDTLLGEAGSDKSRILSALIHLRSIDDFSSMNHIWEGWIPAGAAPARSTVEARLASGGLKVEITIVAAVS